MMTDGLKVASGNRLRDLLVMATRSRLRALALPAIGIGMGLWVLLGKRRFHEPEWGLRRATAS